MSEVELTNWTVTSGYGGNTRQPFVEVIIRPHEVMTQMSPVQARALAMNLLEAAEAAEGDAFIMDFAIKRIGLDEKRAVQILFDFRDWRDERSNDSSLGEA